MLDLLERQWHTASIAAAVGGGEVEAWEEVRQRFEEWLSGEVHEESKESAMRGLLGLAH